MRTESRRTDYTQTESTEYQKDIIYEDNKRKISNTESQTTYYLHLGDANGNDIRRAITWRARQEENLGKVSDNKINWNLAGVYNDLGGGERDYPHEQSSYGTNEYVYDAYGNVDNQATEKASDITTDVGEFVGAGLSEWGQFFSFMMSVVQIVASFINPAIGLALSFIAQVAQAAVQGVELGENLRNAIINLGAQAAGLGIGEAINAAKGALSQVSEIAIRMASSAAISVVSALLQGVTDNQALWKAAASGAASGGVGAIRGSGLSVVSKVILITAINVGAAAIEGVEDAGQLLLIAGLSVAVGLNSGGTGNKGQPQYTDDLGEIGLLFVSALVGTAIAQLMNETTDFEGQVLTSVLMQSAIAVASGIVNNLKSNIGNQVGPFKPSDMALLEKNYNSMGNISSMLNAFSQGLKQGFINNIRNNAGLKTYTIRSGVNAPTYDEQMRTLSEEARVQAYVQQTVMYLSNEISLSGIVGGLTSAGNEIADWFNNNQSSTQINNQPTKATEQKAIENQANDIADKTIAVNDTDNAFMLIKELVQDGEFTAADKESLLKAIGIEALKESSLFNAQEIKSIKNLLGNEALEAMAVLLNGKEMMLFFDGDTLKGTAMMNASGQQEVRTFNFTLGADGKIAVTTGQIFRMIGNKYQAIGSFALARKDTAEFKNALSDTEKRMENILNKEELADKLANAESVYTEKDNEGNITRQVYLDGSGKALISESLMADGSMKMLVYDYDNLSDGVLAKGQVFKTGDNGKYGAQAAGTFIIKQQNGVAGLNNAGKAIIEALGAGQMSRTVYTETMNNGNARQISTNDKGQIEYIHNKSADGKERIVTFGVIASKAKQSLENVDVVNFNDLSQDEQNTIVASLPVMNDQDPALITSKLVDMQDALNMAKLAKQAQAMGFELDVKDAKIFLTMPNGKNIQILNVFEDKGGLSAEASAKAGSLIMQGRELVTTDDSMSATGAEVIIAPADSQFVKDLKIHHQATKDTKQHKENNNDRFVNLSDLSAETSPANAGMVNLSNATSVVIRTSDNGQITVTALDANRQPVGAIHELPKAALDQAFANMKDQGNNPSAANVGANGIRPITKSLQAAAKVTGTTTAVLTKESIALLKVLSQSTGEIKLLISDLREGKLDQIAAIINKDERLMSSVMPLTSVSMKVAGWLVNKYQEVTGKQSLSMSELRAIGSQLTAELEGLLQAAVHIGKGIINGAIASETGKAVVHAFRQQIKTISIKVDENIIQRLQYRVGSIGKIVLGNILSSERLKEVAKDDNASFWTVLGAAVDPREVMTKTLNSLRETENIGLAQEIKAHAVFYGRSGLETLKLVAMPGLYGVQAAGPISGRMAGNIASGLGADDKTALAWENGVGQGVFYLSLGTLIAGNLGAGAAAGSGLYILGKGAEQGGAWAIERGASQSLAHLTVDSLWVVAGVYGPKAMKSMEPAIAKLGSKLEQSSNPVLKGVNQQMVLSKAGKLLNDSISAKEQAWKNEMKAKGMEENYGLWSQKLAREELPRIFNETPAGGLDKAAGGEFLLREIQGAHGELSKVKAEFRKTIAESGKTIAESGKTIAESGKTIAESGKTIAESGKTIAESGKTLRTEITGAGSKLQETGIESTLVHAYQQVEKGVGTLKDAERPRDLRRGEKQQATRPAGSLLRDLFAPDGLIGGMAVPATGFGSVLLLLTLTNQVDAATTSPLPGQTSQSQLVPELQAGTSQAVQAASANPDRAGPRQEERDSHKTPSYISTNGPGSGITTQGPTDNLGNSNQDTPANNAKQIEAVRAGPGKEKNIHRQAIPEKVVKPLKQSRAVDRTLHPDTSNFKPQHDTSLQDAQPGDTYQAPNGVRVKVKEKITSPEGDITVKGEVLPKGANQDLDPKANAVAETSLKDQATPSSRQNAAPPSSRQAPSRDPGVVVESTTKSLQAAANHVGAVQLIKNAAIPAAEKIHEISPELKQQIGALWQNAKTIYSKFEAELQTRTAKLSSVAGHLNEQEAYIDAKSPELGMLIKLASAVMNKLDENGKQQFMTMFLSFLPGGCTGYLQASITSLQKDLGASIKGMRVETFAALAKAFVAFAGKLVEQAQAGSISAGQARMMLHSGREMEKTLKVNPDWDTYERQQLSAQLGTHGQAFVSMIYGMRDLRAAGENRDSAASTRMMAAMNPLNVLHVSFSIIENSSELTGTQKAKVRGVILGMMAVEVLKAANPIIYAAQAAKPLAEDAAKGIMILVNKTCEMMGLSFRYTKDDISRAQDIAGLSAFLGTMAWGGNWKGITDFALKGSAIAGSAAIVEPLAKAVNDYIGGDKNTLKPVTDMLYTVLALGASKAVGQVLAKTTAAKENAALQTSLARLDARSAKADVKAARYKEGNKNVLEAQKPAAPGNAKLEQGGNHKPSPQEISAAAERARLLAERAKGAETQLSRITKGLRNQVTKLTKGLRNQVTSNVRRIFGAEKRSTGTCQELREAIQTSKIADAKYREAVVQEALLGSVESGLNAVKSMKDVDLPQINKPAPVNPLPAKKLKSKPNFDFRLSPATGMISAISVSTAETLGVATAKIQSQVQSGINQIDSTAKAVVKTEIEKQESNIANAQKTEVDLYNGARHFLTRAVRKMVEVTKNSASYYRDKTSEQAYNIYKRFDNVNFPRFSGHTEERKLK